MALPRAPAPCQGEADHDHGTAGDGWAVRPWLGQRQYVVEGLVGGKGRFLLVLRRAERVAWRATVGAAINIAGRVSQVPHVARSRQDRAGAQSGREGLEPIAENRLRGGKAGRATCHAILPWAFHGYRDHLE